MGYFGGRYFSKGGDSAQERHYQKLLAVAEENGVLSPQNHSILPDGLKSAFSRVADLLMRPNFAIAGMVDVLQGTGRADETVGGRVARELFSGVSGLKGDKETFGDILEQRGIGEGGRLSDITGETFLSRHGIDPTTRGTIALGLDIFTDPLTYITAPAAAVKVIGRGGEIALSKAGREMATKLYTENLHKVASRWLENPAAMELGDLEQFVVQQYKKRGLYKSLGSSADDQIRYALDRKYRQKAISDLIESGATGLDAPMRTINFAGKSIMATSHLEKPLQALHTSLTGALSKSEIGRDLIKNTGDIIDSIDKLFNRLPRLARKIPAFKAVEGRRFALHNSAAMRADMELRDIFGKWLSHTDGEDWAVLSRALDNPSKYRDAWVETAVNKIGMDANEAVAIFDDIRSQHKLIASAETSANVLDNTIPNYMLHTFKKNAPGEEVLGAIRKDSSFRGADVGIHNKNRVAETFDELEAIKKQYGLDFEVEYNPAKLFKARFEAHLKAMADADFQQDLLRMFAVGSGQSAKASLDKLLPKTAEYLKGLSKEITEKEASTVTDLLSRTSTISGKTAAKAVRDADYATLRSLRPEVRAAFFAEALGKIESLGHFENFLRKYGPLMDDLPPEVLTNLRQVTAKSEMMGLRYAGQPYVEYAITRGPGKGTWLLPKGIAEDLERFKGVWQDAPEVGALLRRFDQLTNTFKLWVTGVFPAFHVRNGYSNIFASLVDIGMSALDPRRHKEALDIMMGKEGTLKIHIGGGKYKHEPYQAIRQQMAALDVEVSRRTLADIGKETSAAIGERIFTPRQKAGRLEREVVGQTLIENEARALHYIALRRRGMSPEDAAAQMKSFLFDYADLSEFERKVMRRLIPFYSWQSKNIRRQAANLATRPGRLGAQVKVFDQDRGPDNDMLPEYLRGDLQIKLQKRPGIAAAFITNIDLPISNVNVLWKGSLGRTLRDNVAMFNPLIKTPLEIAFNMDSFSGRPIKGSQWIGQMGPALDRSLPQWAKDYFELRKIDLPNGQSAYRANGLKIYLTFKSMFVGRLINTGVTVESLAHDFGKSGKPNYAAVLKLLSGLQLREYSFDQAEKAEIANKVDRLEALMLDKGLASEFSKVFVSQ